MKNNIKDLLEEKGLSIYRLAELLEMSYSPTYKIVNRDDLSNTPLITLMKVAEVLEVKIDDIFSG